MCIRDRHSNVNLENLLLYRNIENKAPLAEEKGIEDRKISNDEKLKEILVNEILTMDEVSDINRIIEMTIDEENKRKINFNMKWIEAVSYTHLLILMLLVLLVL